MHKNEALYQEVAKDIIYIFEEILEKKNITIFNQDKKQSNELNEKIVQQLKDFADFIIENELVNVA